VFSCGLAIVARTQHGGDPARAVGPSEEFFARGGCLFASSASRLFHVVADRLTLGRGDLCFFNKSRSENGDWLRRFRNVCPADVVSGDGACPRFRIHFKPGN